MKIIDLRVSILSRQLDRAYWMSLESYRTSSCIIVQLVCDDGPIGIGEAHGRPLEDIARIIQSWMAPILIGRDPHEIASIWADLFSLCHSRRGAEMNASHGQPHFGGANRAQVMAAIAAIDLALWDIKGKLANQPVYRLLGGSASRIPAYASGGYYGPDGGANIHELVDEMTGYVQQGFSGVKMKIGGLSITEDYERVSAVRTAVGDHINLMLDANMAYRPSEAIQAAKVFEDLRPYWLEEPVRWYDRVFGTKQVADSTSIPIAGGESETHRWECRDLILHAGLQVMQFDATRAGGASEWLRVATYSECHDIGMAPHHDPHIHGHLFGGASNGLILEVFPNQKRDPLWHEFFLGNHQLQDGCFELSSDPGFGYSLDSKELEGNII